MMHKRRAVSGWLGWKMLMNGGRTPLRRSGLCVDFDDFVRWRAHAVFGWVCFLFALRDC